MTVTGFIPVRGGSKSIPGKNIKLFCGKPLVCWLIEAMEASTKINEIVVATESDEIMNVVRSKNFKKVTIFERSSINAKDESTTESVILEYLESKNEKSINDLFILGQATTPFTQTFQLDGSISEFQSKQYDSLLTCSILKKFLWDITGKAINYDYNNRPRRQEFRGIPAENGAFYISKVGNILKSRCRLSGKIGLYVLPEYFLTEIDSIDDWHYAEFLMKKYVLDHNKVIKLVLSDVDGVLTDAGMYYSENGDEMKKFNTRDGMGFELLRKAGIKTGIITSEKNEIVRRRASKLKIDHLYQGVNGKGKLEAVNTICKEEGLKISEVAYIGDDINCIDVLRQ